MAWEWFSFPDELPEPVVDLLAVLLERPAWQRDGLCIEHPEVNFFTERGESRARQAVCAACLVRAECAAHAVEHNEKFGVWGGTTARTPRALREAQEAA